MELLINSLAVDFIGFNFNFYLIRIGAASPALFGERFDVLLNDLGYWQVAFCRLHIQCTPVSILPRSFDDKSGLLSAVGIHYSLAGYTYLGSDVGKNFLSHSMFKFISGSDDWNLSNPYILVYLPEFDV